MTIHFKGLAEVRQRLQRIITAAERPIPMGELFTPDFMQGHTQFEGVAEFLEAGGFEFKTIEEFSALPIERLDAHVRASTDFDGWEAMKIAAGNCWARKQ